MNCELRTRPLGRTVHRRLPRSRRAAAGCVGWCTPRRWAELVLLAASASAQCTYFEPFGEVGEMFEVLGKRCQFADGNLNEGLGADTSVYYETLLQSVVTSERACAKLVRETEPSATGATYNSNNNRCLAEFGDRAAVAPLRRQAQGGFRSCLLEDIGAPEISARDVLFRVGGASFRVDPGEGWQVGQKIVVTERPTVMDGTVPATCVGFDGIASCGPYNADEYTCVNAQQASGDMCRWMPNCPAALGTFKVKSMDPDAAGVANQIVVVEVINGAMDASLENNIDQNSFTGVNNWCQVSGTTNVVWEGGEPCHACPAGKQPHMASCTDPGSVCASATGACPAGCTGSPGACSGTATCAATSDNAAGCPTGCLYTPASNTCVPCDPGEWSSDVGTCHECSVGTSWGPLMALGSTISTAQDGCVYCQPGTFKVTGLTITDVFGTTTVLGTNDVGAGTSAACNGVVGNGAVASTGSRVEMVGTATTLAECAQLVLNSATEQFANGVSFCPPPGRSDPTLSPTGTSRECTPYGCFALTDMMEIRSWQAEYHSCFLDLECQDCPAGTQASFSTQWVTGNGLGGTAIKVGDASNAAACAAAVKEVYPAASGASFAKQSCFAETGIESICSTAACVHPVSSMSSQRVSGDAQDANNFVTTVFGSCADPTRLTQPECAASPNPSVWTWDTLTAPAPPFVLGDAISNQQEQWMGDNVASAEACAALVKAASGGPGHYCMNDTNANDGCPDGCSNYDPATGEYLGTCFDSGCEHVALVGQACTCSTCPSYNGATYMQKSGFQSGDSNQACYAEFDMSTIDVGKDTWQATHFLNTGCEACPPGKVSVIPGSPDGCELCPGGKEPNSDASECKSCPAGRARMYSMGTDDDTSTCTECPEGRFAAAGAMFCSDCEPGKAPNDARSACAACDPGKQAAGATQGSDGGHKAGEPCTPCGPGLDPNTARTACVTCEKDFIREGSSYTDGAAAPCYSCRDEDSTTSNPRGTRLFADWSSTNGPLLNATNGEGHGSTECVCQSGGEDYTGVSYYSMTKTWAAAKKGTADAAALAAALPWHMQAGFDADLETTAMTDGWYSGGTGSGDFPILIDRTVLTSSNSEIDGHYSDFESSHLAEKMLHNTYYLQCFANGKQEASSSAFASVISGALKKPSEGGTAACVSCDSAAECVTCCNQRQKSTDTASTDSQNVAAQHSWVLPVNCSADESANSIAVPKKGWWRTSIDSPVLHRCPKLEACLGGHETPCDVSAGYRASSVMCSACQPGFMKSSDGACHRCPSRILSMLMVLGTMLVVLIICMFLIMKNNHSVRLPNVDDVLQIGVTSAEKVTIAFRILMAFIQLTRLTTGFILPWPTFVEDSVETVAVVTEPSAMMMAFPCLADVASTEDESRSFTITKAALVSIAPAICIVLPMLWYGIAKLRSRGKESVIAGDDSYSTFGDRTTAAIVCLIFVIYPSVVKSTFGLFTCITLEEELSVLRADNGLRCHEGEHGDYVWLITIPSIFIWVIGIPLAAGLTMKHYRDKPNPLGEEGECMLYAVSIQRKFAFLYKGYEQPYYYWELVVLSRKMIFVIIDVLGEQLGPVIQTVFALITVSIALLLHIQCEPFQVAEIDKLERLSLTSSMFTLIAGLFYYGRVHDQRTENGQHTGISLLCTTLIFIMNFAVIAHFVIFIVQGGKQSLRKKRLEKQAQTEVVPVIAQSTEELPAAFIDKHEKLNLALTKLDDINSELDQIGEELPGFENDITTAQLWIGRMKGSVDWKERQADAVVRRHRWKAKYDTQGNPSAPKVPADESPSPRASTRTDDHDANMQHESRSLPGSL